ncbi:TonB-dependent receptor [Parapedobacter indicus]|uniref:Iron complex outermembrane recepter protein n=1 Tax=Parapedobacter indicus TaxID=1477437 RepID=A0A1I3F1F5_9SPHI|nr:TonB-dependent receptor [Parapedobacter indicus]PPL03519.1 iron complex outermembrane receptor protein [Parapedobacter indicus]SFI05105.1 iron complex outermembrane recepter protein [Parapedobacter indicus]
MNVYPILRTTFLLCFAAWMWQANAQNLFLTGHIYDTQTRQPLAGATIRNNSGQVVAQSDKDGFFRLSQAQATTAIDVALMGYKTQHITIAAEHRDINIQLETDPVQLDEVRVGLNSRVNRATPGSIALLTADDIQRGSGMSLQSALNTVPGVRMDQSTLSDSRISIRGNGVRSPWGSRAIKVYINDIPVTETDGTTRIEALDVNNIGRVEVIKGPASSIYGAGTAGVINFQLQRAPYGERSLEVSGLTGSYGLNRTATTFRSGGDKVNSYVAYGWQEYNGYRLHSNDMRRFITGNFQFFPNDKQIITVLVSRTTQHSQIPGALTQTQVSENPLQANVTNVDKQAGRYQNWTRVGIGQQYRLSDKLTNSTSLFSYFYDLNHPLAYAYIRNYYQSYGGRTRFTYDPGFNMFTTVFTVGAEFNQGLTKGSQYVNEHGLEGAINANIDNQNTFYSLFYQSETALGPKTLLTLGLGVNSLQYRVRDYLAPGQSGVKRFDPQATPRIALSHTFHEALSLHASVSTGFTPPTGSEIKTVDGSINPLLQAEKAVNYELNAKGGLLRSRLSYDLAIFRMDMSGELIAQAVQQGITIYHNAGKTGHRGAELALSWLAVDEADSRWIQRLRPFAAITYSDFTFIDYKIHDADDRVTDVFDGNRLTGIAPWVINAGIDFNTKMGLYVNCNYLYNDHLPLNDANTVHHPAYHLLNTKIGYARVIRKRFKAEIYGGVDNLLNQRYSSFVALNAVAYGGGQPAFYNPSPDRSGYGGLNVSFLF